MWPKTQHIHVIELSWGTPMLSHFTAVDAPLKLTNYAASICKPATRLFGVYNSGVKFDLSWVVNDVRTVDIPCQIREQQRPLHRDCGVGGTKYV